VCRHTVGVMPRSTTQTGNDRTLKTANRRSASGTLRARATRTAFPSPGWPKRSWSDTKDAGHGLGRASFAAAAQDRRDRTGGVRRETGGVAYVKAADRDYGRPGAVLPPSPGPTANSKKRPTKTSNRAPPTGSTAKKTANWGVSDRLPPRAWPPRGGCRRSPRRGRVASRTAS